MRFNINLFEYHWKKLNKNTQKSESKSSLNLLSMIKENYVRLNLDAWAGFHCLGYLKENAFEIRIVLYESMQKQSYACKISW